jgi:hypothetical protein
MKYLILSFFVTSLTSASILGPVLTCTNKEKSFTLEINNHSEGSVKFKQTRCPVQIVEMELNRNKVGQNNLNVNYVVKNCGDIFYEKSFLKIEENDIKNKYIAYALALRGSQTFECKTPSSEVQKLLKIAEKK